MQGVCAANFFCESMAPFFGSTIVIPRDVDTIELTNTAVFGMVSFNIADNASLTIEGRYQDENIDQRAVVQDLGDTAEPPVVASAAFDGFLPRVTLDWRPSDDHMVYVAYATGTKPGGFNSTVAIEAGVADLRRGKRPQHGDRPEEHHGRRPTACERRGVLERTDRLSAHAERPLGAGIRSRRRSIAGDADINGFEAELVAAPADLRRDDTTRQLCLDRCRIHPLGSTRGRDCCSTCATTAWSTVPRAGSSRTTTVAPATPSSVPSRADVYPARPSTSCSRTSNTGDR